MPIWTLDSPPTYKPDAIATERGWVDPVTGEVLIAITNLKTKAGAADVQSVSFGASSYSQGGPISVIVKFNERVDVTVGAAIEVSFTGASGNFFLNAVAQSNTHSVTFNKQGDNTTQFVLPTSSTSVGVLTLTGNALDTETVVIGSKTYTFQTVLTDVDGNVLIGATASDSLDNLIAAITLGTGSGSLYAASTTVHPTVTASAGAGDTMNVSALVSGAAGNSIATTETLTNGSFGAATLLGGVSENGVLSIAAQSISGTVKDAGTLVASNLTVSAPKASGAGTRTVA